MYNKILVALDTSPTSEPVFLSALTLAKSLKSQLMLLHVLSPNASDSPINFTPYPTSYDIVITQEFQRQWEKFQQECEQMLKSWKEKAIDEGVKADYNQLYGNPGSVICHFANDWKADLIVMGRRGQSTVSEIFLGSVSSYVIHRSRCCVHLVQS